MPSKSAEGYFLSLQGPKATAFLYPVDRAKQQWEGIAIIKSGTNHQWRLCHTKEPNQGNPIESLQWIPLLERDIKSRLQAIPHFGQLKDLLKKQQQETVEEIDVALMQIDEFLKEDQK